MATSGVRRWYQRSGMWLAVSLAALVIAPVPFVLLAIFPLGELAGFAVLLLAPVTSVLIPAGLWMGALVSQQRSSQVVLGLSTLLFLFIAALALWSYLDGLETEAAEECFLIEASDPDVVDQYDVELCESLTGGELDVLERWSWVGFFGLWIVPLFVLYFLRRRFQPG